MLSHFKMVSVIVITFLTVLSMGLTDAAPQVKLIPSDVIYFTNGGSLIFTCTVDQNVSLNSVVFERDQVTQIGIYNPESLNCTPQNFQQDRHNYTTTCYQQRNFTLIKHGVNAEDHNKHWHCSVVSNPDGPCTGHTPCMSENTTAILQDTPIVKLQAEVRYINPFRLKEGRKNVVLTCEVVAAYPVPILFIWTHNGSEVQNGSRSTITIPVATRETGGTWGCKGVNNYGISSESQLQMDVQYGPVINPIGNKTTIEGNSFSMTCQVDANPPPVSVSWTKDNNATFIVNTSMLTMGHVSRYDSGTYRCTAVNLIHPSGQFEEFLNGSEEFYLNVQYGAEITNVSVVGDSTVNENSTATLICRVDSNPESNINWTKQGTEGTLKADFSVYQSQLIIEHAQCLETGNYTCIASNDLSAPVVEWIPIYVTCHPRTDFRSSPVTKVYSKYYGNADLIYTVISFPEPRFTWSFIGNESENMELPDSARQHDTGLRSTLRFKSLNVNDFGFYKVIANNSFSPSAAEVFELIAVDVPEVPSNVTVTDVKQTSMTVQWCARYNGGLEQTFHIMITAGDVTRSVYAPDPGNGKVGTHKIEDLMSNTEYSIYMSANNSMGSSNNTNMIFQTTLKEANVPATDQTSSKAPNLNESIGIPVAWITGGISAGLFGILIVGIGIFLWRRYQHPKNNGHDKDIQGVRDESTGRKNKKTDSVLKDDAKETEYEGLHITRAEENEYIQLNGITSENNRNVDKRLPGNDLYETLHFDSNSDIQIYSSLKIEANI